MCIYIRLYNSNPDSSPGVTIFLALLYLLRYHNPRVTLLLRYSNPRVSLCRKTRRCRSLH